MQSNTSDAEIQELEQVTETPPGRSQKHGAWFWVGIAALLFVVLLVVSGEILLVRAAPILRARLIQGLSARFHSRVEMGALQVSLLRGFQVSGQDLAIYPYNVTSSTPTFAVRHFAFRTGYASLFRSPMHIGSVDVDGLRIHLAPKSQRSDKQQLQQPAARGTQGSAAAQQSKVSIAVGEMHCTDTILTLGTDKPDKVPLQFLIHTLDLRSIGAGKPLDFTALLTNPKPQGEIVSRGTFGPWNADHPGATFVAGTYSFRHADLSIFKGIAGMLSSDGAYQGTLDKIVADGKTDTPDFQIRISGHKVALHTEFHAIVDGTDGDTYLQPVKARFLHSTLLARGYVVREKGEPGRHTYLDVAMDQARIEDLLRLGVRTDPPVIDGELMLRTKVDLPPGHEDVAHRLRLQGKFAITNGRFSSAKIQTKVDELSLRSRGQVELAREQARDGKHSMVLSQMNGDFSLKDASLNLPDLHYEVPGASIKLAGIYTLDGARFNFTGTADLQATLSRMVGGWKGLLLTPVNKFFEKNGAGTEVPFKIDGTQSAPHFGLDLGRRNPPTK